MKQLLDVKAAELLSKESSVQALAGEVDKFKESDRNL